MGPTISISCTSNPNLNFRTRWAPSRTSIWRSRTCPRGPSSRTQVRWRWRINLNSRRVLVVKTRSGVRSSPRRVIWRRTYCNSKTPSTRTSKRSNATNKSTRRCWRHPRCWMSRRRWRRASNPPRIPSWWSRSKRTTWCTSMRSRRPALGAPWTSPTSSRLRWWTPPRNKTACQKNQLNRKYLIYTTTHSTQRNRLTHCTSRHNNPSRTSRYWRRTPRRASWCQPIKWRYSYWYTITTIHPGKRSTKQPRPQS